MENKFNFLPHTCNRRITVKERYGRDPIETFEWLDMRAQIVIKWDWYFKYRAALLQVKYPRYLVQLVMWNTEPSEFTKAQLEEQVRKRRITTCKRMITKISNGINAFLEIENAKLLPNLDAIHYKDAMVKLQKYKDELKEFQNGE